TLRHLLDYLAAGGNGLGDGLLHLERRLVGNTERGLPLNAPAVALRVSCRLFLTQLARALYLRRCLAKDLILGAGLHHLAGSDRVGNGFFDLGAVIAEVFGEAGPVGSRFGVDLGATAP